MSRKNIFDDSGFLEPNFKDPFTQPNNNFTDNTNNNEQNTANTSNQFNDSNDGNYNNQNNNNSISPSSSSQQKTGFKMLRPKKHDASNIPSNSNNPLPSIRPRNNVSNNSNDKLSNTSSFYQPLRPHSVDNSANDNNMINNNNKFENMMPDVFNNMTSQLAFQTANAMANQYGLPAIYNQLPSIFSLHYYKYYFQVDNKYVINKLKIILLPFLKLNMIDWKRLLSNTNNISNGQHLHNPYDIPINDVNAPDAYVPLMAIVTYIVIMGFMIGYQHNDRFSPQILIATASSCFGMLMFEVILMKLGFYLIGSVAQPPFWLDSICYAGYKLVFVVVNLIIFLLIDMTIVWYVMSLLTGILAAVFMIQTLRPYFKDPSFTNNNHYGSDDLTKTKQIFFVIICLIQIAFVFLMGRYV